LIKLLTAGTATPPVLANVRFAPTGDIRQATCNGKIERGTAVIERPWIRFSE
jgi:hypothetical protein